jgi:hypothetical protein
MILFKIFNIIYIYKRVDKKFPIFHDDISMSHGDLSECMTIASVVIDVKNKTITWYKDNPKKAIIANQFSLTDFPKYQNK